MDFEKSFNDTDPLNEGEDEEFPRIVRRSSLWRNRAIVGLSLLVVIQTIALISLAWKPIVKDPLLALWCEYSTLYQY